MDVLTPSQRSYNMKRIPSKDTKPEVQLRKALWRRGLRYRKTIDFCLEVLTLRSLIKKLPSLWMVTFGMQKTIKSILVSKYALAQSIGFQSLPEMLSMTRK